MKKILSIGLLLLCCVPMFSRTRAEEIREGLLKRDPSKVFVASHRADWRNWPENSLEAINSAIEMGVDIVEVDLQLTKDSVLIIMHDAKLDRTTTGKGKISETNFADIQKMCLKNGVGIYTRHKVPTLEEVLNLAKGRVMLNLDKADRYFDLVHAMAKKTGTERQLIMKGRKPAKEVKELYGDYLDEILYMPIVHLDDQKDYRQVFDGKDHPKKTVTAEKSRADREAAEKEIADHMKVLNPCAFELLYATDENPLPFKLKKTMKGKSLIWYNCLWDTMAGGHDDDAAMHDINDGYGFLVDKLGVGIIQTDRPAMVIDYLRKRNLHD